MSLPAAIDPARFLALARARHDEFVHAAPFPHVVIDGLLDPAVAEAMRQEFADLPDQWTFLHHFNEHKRIFTDAARMGAVSRATFAELQSPPFLHGLEALTGIDGLISDPELDGGGLHETGPGGFLNVHADFLSHPRQRHWSREINLILFLNHDWAPSYGGALELWDATVTRCERRVEPLFNRCIIFRVGRTSFHGVPDGVHCPPGKTRKSAALYYFADREAPCPLVPSHYVPRPSDPWQQRVLMRLDGAMLHAYTWLKRYTPLNDARVSGILRRLFR